MPKAVLLIIWVLATPVWMPNLEVHAQTGADPVRRTCALLKSSDIAKFMRQPMELDESSNGVLPIGQTKVERRCAWIARIHGGADFRVELFIESGGESAFTKTKRETKGKATAISRLGDEAVYYNDTEPASPLLAPDGGTQVLLVRRGTQILSLSSEQLSKAGSIALAKLALQRLHGPYRR